MRGALLVAVDLIAPTLLPRRLHRVYDRLIGRHARAEMDRWYTADDTWGEPRKEAG